MLQPTTCHFMDCYKIYIYWNNIRRYLYLLTSSWHIDCDNIRYYCIALKKILCNICLYQPEETDVFIGKILRYHCSIREKMIWTICIHLRETDTCTVLDKSPMCICDAIKIMNFTNCCNSLFFTKYAHKHTFPVSSGLSKSLKKSNFLRPLKPSSFQQTKLSKTKGA